LADISTCSRGPTVFIQTIFGIFHPKRERIPMCKMSGNKFNVLWMKYRTGDKMINYGWKIRSEVIAGKALE